jgi:hypothetical protein
VSGPQVLLQITTQPKPRSRRLLRAALAVLGAVLLLGLAAPFINAAYFAGNIRRALEASLGRQADFDKVYFKLFPLPGFVLENVTIHEDPRFGLEPFAHAGSVDARLRIDKLLVGQIRLSSLRLVEPSLNLVKRADGTWNVVELVERLSAPRRLPLNLFPAIEVSGGRIDFKLGTRKTTLYIADSDLSIYPERSGKVVVQFSGSPARTDRAGNGFGHMRGTVNWYVNPPNAQANQLEADVTLDPSNLSEVATLIEGHDIGVHGTISSHALVEGPAGALRVTGELRLEDVHRWDLMPSSGDDWRIRYDGRVDLPAHRFDLRTLPGRSGEVVPVGLQVRVNDFLTSPAWSIFATLHKAPLQWLLPLGKRMGLALPPGLEMSGVLDGVVGYSNSSGLAGGIAVTNAVATLPNIPPLRSAVANVQISANAIHIDPAILQADVGGTLRAGGDYDLGTQHLVASLSADEFPVGALKSATQAWFGAPAALGALADGYITGQFVYRYEGPDSSAAPKLPAWSGQFQFSNGTLVAPGLALPLKHAQGHAVFTATTFDLPRFSATLGQQTLYGSYHYSLLAKRPERVHFDLPSADLSQLEAALAPALRQEGFFAHLPFTRRSIPVWLADRNLEGDIAIGHFSVNQTAVGSLSARFLWQGTNVQFTGLQLHLAQGLVKATGTVDLASNAPRCRFSATVGGFPWGGGVLSAEGQLQTSGTGLDSLRNLHARGSFAGEDVSLSAANAFSQIAGAFDFSFADGWPDLRLSKLQATQDDEDWSGEAASRSDGKLLIDLENGERQLHLVSALTPETAAPSPPLTSQTLPH